MKTVLITGAGKGIGAACAEEFAENGWHVILNYNKSGEQAHALASKICARPVRADVSNANEVQNLRRLLTNEGIHIDCIVNNAGISEECLFTDITEEAWDKMFHINVKSAFLVTKAFLPDMLSKKRGSIINISSVWGEVGASMEVHYSASKAALIGMTKALAKELAPSGIRVNCVCPGYVDTDMNRYFDTETVEEITREIPMGRTASPVEIAKSVYFLASDCASYITGQILGVNGGWNI